MRKYLLIAGLSFQKLVEYRFSFLFSVFTNSMWYLVTYLFWSSLASSGMDVRPYTPQTLAIYYILISVTSIAVGFPYQDVSREIRDGKLAPAILKPISYMGTKFFATVADKTVMLCLLIIVFTLMNFFGVVRAEVTLVNILLFSLSLFAAMIGNFLVYFLAGTIAFWVKHIHGIPALISVMSSIVSGAMIPLELLPAALVLVSKALPFRYFHFFPAQIFLGHAARADIIEGFLIEFIWIILVYLFIKLVWVIGIKRLEVIGT